MSIQVQTRKTSQLPEAETVDGKYQDSLRIVLRRKSDGSACQVSMGTIRRLLNPSYVPES